MVMEYPPSQQGCAETFIAARFALCLTSFSLTYPCSDRNKEPILQVLKKYLPVCAHWISSSSATTRTAACLASHVVALLCAT